MKRINNSIALLFVLLGGISYSCDDGRIYETAKTQTEKGRVLKLTGKVNGVEDWASDYSIVLAGFNEESDYAILTKELTNVAEGGTVETVMTGIKQDVTSLELCVINQLRKRIVSYQVLDCSSSSADTLFMEVDGLNVGMYATIQQAVFNTTCANCHGASTHAAAGLYLIEGKSHEALVDKQSLLIPEWKLVKEYDADESLLYQLLISGISTSWGYDHSKEVLSPDIQDLIGDWINNGALN